jgi:hypothetical protein
MQEYQRCSQWESEKSPQAVFREYHQARKAAMKLAGEIKRLQGIATTQEATIKRLRATLREKKSATSGK